MTLNAAEISRQWILEDAPDNPIGNFEDFDFLFKPEQLAEWALGFWASVNTTGPTGSCTCTCFCTTGCGPITTAGVCGC